MKLMSTLVTEVKNERARTGLVSKYGLIAFQFFVLLFALKIDRKIEWLAPSIWILLPMSLSAALARAKYDDAAEPVVKLWKLIGFLSAVYSLIHYPLLPPTEGMHGRYVLFLALWVASIAAGVLCFRFPSLALLAPAFLLWSISEAQIITGLVVTIDIDVAPLAAVSMCIGLGLFIDQCSRRLSAQNSDAPKFVVLLFLLAVSVHLANYFWSFLAKVKLDHAPLLWLTENNPAALFLVALDDDHILFSAYPFIVEWTYWIIDQTHLIVNSLILVIQGAALLGLLLPKRWFILLLIAFDLMHASLIVVAGLNFWPWIILNLLIAYVVSKHMIEKDFLLKLAATVFIVVAPRFVPITQLGWLDSSANNKLSFEAVDKNGKHYVVPTNFFTFYSYALGHMDYGLPDPRIGFEVDSPNGAVYTKRLLDAGRSCDLVALERQPEMFLFEPESFGRFVRNYHQTALSVYYTLGMFPYDLYPHHFYVPLSIGDDFRRLNKSDIVAYIYKQETVCMSFSDGRPKRKLIALAEYRINVDVEQ